METIEITYGSDKVTMTWNGAEASAPIKLDGNATQYQTADARHRTAEAVRLMCRLAWPEVSWDEGGEAWDEMSYAPVREATVI